MIGIKVSVGGGEADPSNPVLQKGRTKVVVSGSRALVFQVLGTASLTVMPVSWAPLPGGKAVVGKRYFKAVLKVKPLMPVTYTKVGGSFGEHWVPYGKELALPVDSSSKISITHWCGRAIQNKPSLLLELAGYP